MPCWEIMSVSTIEDGELYVEVGFWHNAQTPSGLPDAIEDVTFRGLRATKVRPVTDELGRIKTTSGKARPPKVHVGGRWIEDPEDPEDPDLTEEVPYPVADEVRRVMGHISVQVADKHLRGDRRDNRIVKTNRDEHGLLTTAIPLLVGSQGQP